ncbi:cell division cycle protein 27 homolog B-like isoform X2 [Durio zibethinus]|uniref:Cell division cycle protein 27 homolog B-like isoform X2 n=1 Tax=Durio zibethinus TaxID=66656 RepID=A0A6P5WHX9_DURZI|nr:cell division cycle protein 27 homolog B-like isoform X2 [Durio zibethinus]
MEALLANYVEKSLKQYMRRNAIFLCERLYAEFPSEVNLQLLARCYLNNNQPHSAYHVLKGMQMAQSRYLFAVACLEMDLFSEAETALLPIEELCAHVTNGAAVQYLLGIIHRDTNRMKSSVEHFRKALSIDPLFWAAYEELCILGEAEEAAVCFGDVAIHYVQEHYLGNASSYLQIANSDQSLDSSQAFGLEDLSLSHLQQMEGNNIRNICLNNHGGPNLTGPVGQITNSCCNSSFFRTPSPVLTQLSDMAPPPLIRNIRFCQNEVSLRSSTQARREFVRENESAQIRGSLFFDSGRRRSARLAAAQRSFNSTQGSENKANNLRASIKLNSGTCYSTVCKGQFQNLEEGKLLETYDDAVSAFRATSSSLSSSADVKSVQDETVNTQLRSFISNSSKIKSGISDTINLLRILGEGYRHLCEYRCQEALNVYQKLSSKQYNTGWVLSQVGKAYFELVDYLNADYAFSLARQISPYNLEGMDVYSTVLYLMKEDMKLKYLAQELISIDRFAPQAWCAIGNCYSFQKDHETALKSFQRAVQLNSRFPYAHTLSGHENVIIEDYGNAVECYQKALHVDARHYKSWYGLGMIYLRQEKIEFAEHHFRQAYRINPFSSVIMYYLGTTLEALKRSEEALVMMEKAIVTDNKNPLPKYSKANMLVTLGRLNEALEILEELKECYPRESSIYALMGEIYKQHKKYDKSMLHFGIALDLKPSIVDVAKIQAAIGKLILPDEIEDNL